MKYSLLDLVQTVLTSMDGDEVDSITDTTEAQSVATLARTTYFDIASRANLPEHFTLFQLQASGDNLKPTLMMRPDTVHNVKWIKYNAATVENTEANFRDVQYLIPAEFFNLMYGLNTTDSSVGSFSHTINGDAMTFLYQNNLAPLYFTSFDDRTVIFSSYNTTVDNTLQQVKSACYGEKSDSFAMSDGFTPNLDEQQFALWLNETKALCFSELKQTENPKAERTARRLWTSLQSNKNAFGDSPSSFWNLPNYGRK